MISHNKKFVFLHLPKTAGTSINSTLSNYATYSKSIAYSKHSSLNDIRNEIGDSKFDEYFKFTIVRNPWDRILSLYFWGIQIKPGKSIQSNWHKDSFDRWIKTTFINDRLYNIWPNQIDLMTIDDKPQIDFVGRFENLQSDWRFICEKLEIKDELQFLYSTKHKPFYEYYDNEAIAIVKKYYEKDIKEFGYEFKN